MAALDNGTLSEAQIGLRLKGTNCGPNRSSRTKGILDRGSTGLAWIASAMRPARETSIFSPSSALGSGLLGIRASRSLRAVASLRVTKQDERGPVIVIGIRRSLRLPGTRRRHDRQVLLRHER